MATAGRGKRNQLEVSDVVKILRSNLQEPKEQDYCRSDIETVVATYLALLSDLAKQCPCATPKLLRSAVQEAYKMQTYEAKPFADRLHDDLQYCRNKAYSATSGKKLSSPVYAMVQIFKGLHCRQTELEIETGTRPRRFHHKSAKLKFPCNCACFGSEKG